MRNLSKILISIGLFSMLLSITGAFADTATWDFSNDSLLGTGANTKQVESSITVDGQAGTSNTLNLMAGYMYNTGGSQSINYQCRIATSGNAGASWTDKGIISLGSGQSGSDPRIVSDSSGYYYAICDVISSTGATSLDYWVSTDGGSSWSGPNAISDSNQAATDRPDAAVLGGSNYIYACWQNEASGVQTIYLKRIWPTTGSELTVATGSDTVGSNGPINICSVAVDSSGVVYVTWPRLTADTGGQGYGTGIIQLRRSFDQGGSMESNTQTLLTFNRFPTTINNCRHTWGCILGTSSTGIRISPNPNIAIDSSRNLHLTYGEYSSTSLGDVKYVEITSCTTQNSNCTVNTIVNPANDGGVAKDQFMPEISVSPKTNTVNIVALDRRNSQDNTSWQPWHYHCDVSSQCGSSTDWETTAITTQLSWNVDGLSTIGDYNGLTSSSTHEAHASWPDNRLYNSNSSLRVWMNTWTGDPDIYIKTYDTSGNTLTGLAVSVYDSSNSLVASGYSPMLVGVPSGGAYTVDIDSYGSDQCTSSGDYPAVTSYSVASWGCQATVSVPSTGSVNVNGYYGTNSGSSNNLQVSSADLNDNSLTGFYIQLDNSGGTQIGSGYTTVTFSGLSGSGTQYKVYANSYCNSSTHTNYTPSRWGDGTTGNEDTISLNYNTNIKVYYSTSSC
jgi:hypothetical protein